MTETEHLDMPLFPYSPMGRDMSVFSRRGFIGGLLVFGGSLMLGNFIPQTALAQTSAEVQEQADAVSAQLDAAQEALGVASDNYYAALDEHDAAVARMDEIQAQIDDEEAQITDLQSRLESRVVSMYRNGQSSYLEVLLGATTFDDFVSTWDFLNEMNSDQAQMVAQVKDLKAQAEADREEYSAQEQLAQQKLDEAAAIAADAENTAANLQETLDGLNAEVAELLAQEQAAAQAAAAAAAAAAAEAAAAAATGGTTGGGDDGGNTGGGGGSGSRAPGDFSGALYAAMTKEGCTYVWAAAGPDHFDCSGLVSWAYAQIGYSVPHSSYSIHDSYTQYSISEAQPGDILWMSGHVGLYQGGGLSYEAGGQSSPSRVTTGNAMRFTSACHP